MAITAQKILIANLLSIFAAASSSTFASVQHCTSAAIMVKAKSVGSVNYLAEDCAKPWDQQTIQMDFKYTQDIPGWAFRRAAKYFLNKNVPDRSTQDQLNKITELYQPVKNGDLYRLKYNAVDKHLELILNGKSLGSIQNGDANKYFLIWFGTKPFNAKLKQQLIR